MRRDISLARLAEQARLYVGSDALVAKAPHPTLKPQFDALYRFALTHGLARWLTLAVDKHRLHHVEKRWGDHPLLHAAEQRFHDVQWWAANEGQEPPSDLFLVRTDGFDNDWDAVRAAMEGAKSPPIWHDDPALFVRHSEGYVCRSACVGHEGHVYFFAYDHEDEWVAQLEQARLRQHHAGTAAYLSVIKELGKVAG